MARSRAARALAVAMACSASLLLGACSRDDHAAEGPESVPDQVVLDNLKLAGSDLSKPHNVDFSFYFPDEASVDRFIAKLSREPAYKIEVFDGDDGYEWVVEVTRTFIPSLVTIEETSKELAALAKSEGGEFDGWGAAVVN
jgi:hypothetical protein